MSTHHDPEPAASGAAGVPRVLAGLRSQVHDLAQTLWAARDRAELMATVTEVEALKASLDALELGVVRELEATAAVKTVGWASTPDYVTHAAGGHRGTGPAVLRLAEAVAGSVLAPVGDALAEGWLSTTKAQVIRRAIETLPGDPDLRGRAVGLLLTEAKALNATELRALTRHLLTLLDPEGDERRDERALDRLERAAHLERYLCISDDQAGGAWIRGRCSTEDAAFLKATLIPLAAPHPHAPGAGGRCDPTSCQVPGCSHEGRDPRDHGARMLDALVEACRRLQTSSLLPESHGAVPRLTLTMDYRQLLGVCGFAATETGEELSASTVRRLCCDAELIPAVLGVGSAVLDVGRTQRLVTPAIWRALVARDRHCRFPHCTRPPMMTHAHHVHHWVDGGATSLDNLVLLCGHHHRLVHAGPWQITRTGPAGFEFHPPPTAATHSSGGRPRHTDDDAGPPDG